MCFCDQLRTRQGCEYLVQYDTDSIILDWHKVIMDAIQQLVNSFNILFISCSFPVHFPFISYPVHHKNTNNNNNDYRIMVCIGHISRNRTVFLKKKMRRERKKSGPVCLSVCLSTCLPVCHSLCQSVYLSVPQSTCLSVSMTVYMCLSL